MLNAYSEKIFKEALDGYDIGIKVNVIRINNLRCSDDTVVLADKPKVLQVLLDRVTNACWNGFNINIQKAKTISIRKQGPILICLCIKNMQVELVKMVKYLG